MPDLYKQEQAAIKNILNAVNHVSITTNIRTSESNKSYVTFADKVVTIVSDSGANVKNAVNKHLRKYHHPCVAHTLNLTVSEAINKTVTLKVIIAKCRNLVAHFKHSVLSSNKLREVQNQMNLPVLKVKQDVSTRWNSTLIMMERLVLLKPSLVVALSNLPSIPECLDASEWEIICDCIILLKPIETMTIELSGEKYTTISTIIPLIRGLQHS